MSGTCHPAGICISSIRTSLREFLNKIFFPARTKILAGNTTGIFFSAGFSPGFVMRFFSRRDPGKKGIPGGNPAKIQDGNFFPTGSRRENFHIGGISAGSWQDPGGNGILGGIPARSRRDPGGYFTRVIMITPGFRSILFDCVRFVR